MLNTSIQSLSPGFLGFLNLWIHVISDLQQIFISFSRSENIIDKLFLNIFSSDLYWYGIVFYCHRK